MNILDILTMALGITVLIAFGRLTYKESQKRDHFSPFRIGAAGCIASMGLPFVLIPLFNLIA